VQLSFGSDGYRGVIGHTLTREALARITLGAGSYLREAYSGGRNLTIPVGFDTRFMARDFAGYVVRLLEATGFKPLLAKRPCPSPYLAFATRHHEALIGIQLTASHNAPNYGGVKLKGRHGGSLFPQHADLVETLANASDLGPVSSVLFIAAAPPKAQLDVDKAYQKQVLAAAGWEGDSQLNLLVDFMHGACGGIYREVLDAQFSLGTVLRAEPDPLFAGVKPEPSPARLADLAQMVAIDGTNAVGLAFDGDGDRLAVIDERGNYLAPHEIFCLLLEHLTRHDQRRGVVVTTVSFSGLTERVAAAYGCTVLNVPVGFKHVSRAMVEAQAIIGGEESGGIGFGHYLPERDALLMALTLLHARQLAGATLYEMVEQLYRDYGRPVFIRRDVPLAPDTRRDSIVDQIRELATLEKVAGESVVQLNHCDGMKLWTDSGWVLVRASGTEPLLRIYAEGRSVEEAEAYAKAALANMQLEYSPKPKPD
jgi:phosphomannomutase